MSSGDPLPSIDKTEDDMSASPSPPSSSDGVEIEIKPLLGETRSRLKLSSRDSLENSGEDEKNLSRVDKEMPTSKNQNENELDVYDMTLPRRVARTPFLPGLNFNLGMGLHLSTFFFPTSDNLLGILLTQSHSPSRHCNRHPLLIYYDLSQPHLHPRSRLRKIQSTPFWYPRSQNSLLYSQHHSHHPLVSSTVSRKYEQANQSLG